MKENLGKAIWAVLLLIATSIIVLQQKKCKALEQEVAQLEQEIAINQTTNDLSTLDPLLLSPQVLLSKEHKNANWQLGMWNTVNEARFKLVHEVMSK